MVNIVDSANVYSTCVPSSVYFHTSIAQYPNSECDVKRSHVVHILQCNNTLLLSSGERFVRGNIFAGETTIFSFRLCHLLFYSSLNRKSWSPLLSLEKKTEIRAVGLWTCGLWLNIPLYSSCTHETPCPEISKWKASGGSTLEGTQAASAGGGPK